MGGLRADQLHLDIEPFGHGGGATQLRHAVARAGDDQAAHLFPAHGMAGLPFQSGVEFGAVLIDFGHAVGRAEAPDQPGGVPGGAASKSILLQQDDVLPAEFGEMIGDAAPNDAAADDDNFGFFAHVGVSGSIGVSRASRKTVTVGGGRIDCHTSFWGPCGGSNAS